ncbi:hypothetical protein SprV_0200875300 [Sparganum proliferum]
MICSSPRRCWSSGNVDTDGGGKFSSMESQAELRQAIIGALRQRGQSFCDVLPEGKADASVSSLCPGATAPEEGVAGAHLL